MNQLSDGQIENLRPRLQTLLYPYYIWELTLKMDFSIINMAISNIWFFFKKSRFLGQYVLRVHIAPRNWSCHPTVVIISQYKLIWAENWQWEKKPSTPNCPVNVMFSKLEQIHFCSIHLYIVVEIINSIKKSELCKRVETK